MEYFSNAEKLLSQNISPKNRPKLLFTLNNNTIFKNFRQKTIRSETSLQTYGVLNYHISTTVSLETPRHPILVSTSLPLIFTQRFTLKYGTKISLNLLCVLSYQTLLHFDSFTHCLMGFCNFTFFSRFRKRYFSTEISFRYYLSLH